MYEIIYYSTETDNSPVESFLNDLNKKAKVKVMAGISFLQDSGPELRRPFCAPVRNKNWELRVAVTSNQYRVFYFFWMENRIALLHGIQKKSQQLKEQDIKIAETRMNDWLDRFGRRRGAK